MPDHTHLYIGDIPYVVKTCEAAGVPSQSKVFSVLREIDAEIMDVGIPMSRTLTFIETFTRVCNAPWLDIALRKREALARILRALESTPEEGRDSRETLLRVVTSHVSRRKGSRFTDYETTRFMMDAPLFMIEEVTRRITVENSLYTFMSVALMWTVSSHLSPGGIVIRDLKIIARLHGKKYPDSTDWAAVIETHQHIKHPELIEELFGAVEDVPFIC